MIKIDFSKSLLCESIIKIFSFIRKDFSEERVLSKLKTMLEKVKLYINKEDDQYKKLAKLIKIFYSLWKFRSASGVYKLSEVLWIDNVLKKKKGTAISLGIILIYFAKELGIFLVPVIFPTQLILKAKDKYKKDFFINPINGEILTSHMLKGFLKGCISPTAKLYKSYLNETQPKVIIQKLLDSLKIALMEEKKMDLALNTNKVLLYISPNDPYEIRDRGLIYAKLDCNHIALADLIYFTENCPEDPISDIIKIQIHAIQKRKIILH